MKKLSTVVQWVFAALFGLCAIGNGFHWTSLLLVISAVLMMPLHEIRKTLKLKTLVAVLLSVILLFVGILNSPVSTEEILADSYYSEGTVLVTDTESESTASAEDTSSSEVELDAESNPTDGTSFVGTGTAEGVNLSTIPAYSGTAFVTINDNIPNFSAKELEISAYENYSELDSLGRCGTATAVCGKEIMPAEDEERGSISSIKPSGWIQAKYSGISGGYLYNRCHLIGWQLSAENANDKNLITGTRYMNTEGMLPFENMVADYIKETNNHVAYRVTPIFEESNLLCSGVQIEAYSIEDNGEGITFNVYCYNVQPDITIDYATGKSSAQSGDTNSTTSSEDSSYSSASSTASTTVSQSSAAEASSDTAAASSSTEQAQLVWIPATGSKYHSKSSCSNMKNPSQVTLDQAVSLGYEPCKKCY